MEKPAGSSMKSTSPRVPTAAKKSAAESSEGVFKKKPVTFKCGCDFGGADYSMGKTEGIDCDCQAAKCTCEKKCKCRPKDKDHSKNNAEGKEEDKPKFREMFETTRQQQEEKGEEKDKSRSTDAVKVSTLSGTLTENDKDEGEYERHHRRPLIHETENRSRDMNQQWKIDPSTSELVDFPGLVQNSHKNDQ